MSFFFGNLTCAADHEDRILIEHIAEMAAKGGPAKENIIMDAERVMGSDSLN